MAQARGARGVWRQKIWAPLAESKHESYEAWLRSLQAGWRKRETMYATEPVKHRSTIFPKTYDRL